MVDFEPSTGTISPNSKTELSVCFRPHVEKPINFNVLLNILKKPSTLALNVKGEGYAIHASMHVESIDGALVELSSSSRNNISFGQVGYA